VTDRWARIGRLFDAAVVLPATGRDALLQSSGEPSDLVDEVRSLLAAHDTAGPFLDPSTLPRGESDATAANPEGPQCYPGSLVGPYRIVRVIGRGGMGVVFEAEDTRLGRRVALKSLPQASAADERQRRRLRQEARAAAALQHPGIATIYALEEIEGQLFISAEYLEGDTLRAEVRRGPLSVDAAGRAGVQITRALAVAHERGIVHRDLKPENIVRTTDGVLKILDFGLAHVADPTSVTVSNTRLTQPGLIVGTPAYMAPEQLLGRPTDFRVDHFALGVMLYELCTGSHPFGEGSLPSTIARILADAPDGPRTPGTVSSSLWPVIERCLQKDPHDRFASTRDLLAALESAIASAASAAPAAPGRTLPHPAAPGRTQPHPAAPSRTRPHPAAGAPDVPPASPAILRWWRFHQFAAAATYWAMVWPVWHVHRSLGGAGLFVFFATLAAVVISANLRLHLWFSSRVYPEDLPSHRADVARWIWWADAAFAILLIGGGVALPEDRAGWAAVLISVGVGSTVGFVFIEPATARAAFRRWYQV
jgi:serine/threonine protein kinase